MTSGDAWSREAVLAAFDEHLRKSRGLCPGTRDNYCRFVELFLQASFPGDEVEVGNIRASQVIEFIAGAADRYQPKTVELVASSLRSFFRFARAEGLRTDRLDDAVPMVPHRRSGLVRHLDPETLERLILSLGSSSGRDLRDRAIMLCLCRLGLRALAARAWGYGRGRVRAKHSSRRSSGDPLCGEIVSEISRHERARINSATRSD